jgi:signal transduction histidine kinase
MFFDKLNIRERLTLQFLVFVGVLFIGFSVSIYYFGQLYIENRFYKKLQDRALVVSTLYFDFNAGQKAMLLNLENKGQESLEDEAISIYDISRKLFVISSNIEKEQEHADFLKYIDSTASIFQKQIGPKAFVGLAILDKSGKYVVTVSAIDKTGTEALLDLKNILSVLILVALMFITALAWYFANKALGPIMNIGLQLNEIFPKNLNKRIRHDRPYDEIGALTKTLNNLLGRAQENIDTQKLFLANISHELKNPLTRIFTQIELLEIKYSQNGEFLKQISSLKQDTASLINLNETILNLANIYTSEAKFPLKPVRIDETVLEALAEFKKWKPEVQLDFQISQIPDSELDFICQGNEEALKIVFKNLMDNASKFSTDNMVKIELAILEKDFKISFCNTGPEILPEDLDKIFEPFYRSDATAKGKKGHGIGLAVVKQIITMHRGHININRSVANENIFSVILPK